LDFLVEASEDWKVSFATVTLKGNDLRHFSVCVSKAIIRDVSVSKAGRIEMGSWHLNAKRPDCDLIFEIVRSPII